MRIMVMGATGMLGHQLLQDLSLNGHEVVGTVRRSSDPRLERYGILTPVITKVDALAVPTVRSAVKDFNPDVVINCIGLVKQLESLHSTDLEIELNARFPHVLARICSDLGCRLIHVSTDCVFAGNRGMYRETDRPDAADLYGCSKAAGEVLDVDGCLTIRTSIIGHELTSCNGLLEWFLRQDGVVRGRSRAIFSGFPTTVLAQVINTYVLPDKELHGLYHISSQAISKYELLKLFKQFYDRDIEITCDDTFVLDRSLDSERFRTRTGFRPDSWPRMVKAMTKSPARSL